MDEIYPGRCIVWPQREGARPHLWIVLTEPAGDPPEVVVVNLTTPKMGADTTTVLNKGDHPFVKHETVVYYADARFASAIGLEAYAKAPGNRFHTDCSDDLLRRVRDGLLKSRFTPNKIKTFCAARFR